MFDTTIIQPVRDQHHHHRTDVHEHRAPTDDSVKLLKEMESAALDKLLGSVKLENCPVSGVVHMMQDHFNLEYKYIIEYKIGSRTERVNVTMDIHSGDSIHQAQEKTFIKLRDELAKDIANNIISECFENVGRRLAQR